MTQLCLWMDTPKPRVIKPDVWGSPGQRAAALGKLDGGVVEALHHHTVGGVDLAQIHLGQLLVPALLALPLLPLFLQLGQAVGNGDAAVADGGIKLLGIVLAQAAGTAVDKIVQLVVRKDDHFPAQLTGQCITSLRDIFLAAHLFEPVSDLTLRFAGAHDLEPVATGAFVRRAKDHFDDLAGGNDVVDGHHAVVHLAAHHALPTPNGSHRQNRCR